MIRLLLLLTVCVIGSSLGSGAVAQSMFGRGMVPGQFVEPPRSLRKQLSDADRALKENQPSEAVVILGDLLAGDLEIERDLIGQDFLLDAEIDEKTVANRSLVRTARERIGSLANDARQTYEIRYGPAAKKLLDEAAENRDWEKVAEVRRKYFHTRAGYQATGLMAIRSWIAGNATEASLLLDEVVSQEIAQDVLGNQIVDLYLSACKVANRAPSPALELASRKDRSDDDDDALAAGPIRDDASGDYAWTGRNANRNGSEGGQFPLSVPRWDVDTTASPRQSQAISDRESEFLGERRLPIPSLMPVCIGNQVLVRTTERLVGIEHRTGKRFWYYPWQSPYEAQDETEIGFDEFENDDEHSDLVSQRVWNDVPYGQVTSDGQRAYMIDNLEEVELARYSAMMMNIRGRSTSEKDTNTLVALDLEGEGKLVWRLGKDGDPNSPLAKSFFLGPPLPVEGRLYAMAETAGDIELVCLDPNDGNLVWRQHLVSVETGAIDTDAIRRIAGAMPSESQGILICPTGAGVVVAINRHDRTIRWARRHGRSENRFITRHPRTRNLDALDLFHRWDNSLAVIADNTVLLPAVEDDRLFGFDLATGKMLFDPKSRSQMRYLAGVHDGRFLIVGGNSVRAYSLANGRPLWSSDGSLLDSGTQICGRGYFDESSYYAPTSDHRILRISMTDGSLIDTREVEYPLGNMTISRGEVIIQSPTKVTIAHGERSLRPWVEKRLSENENDLGALLKLSQLQLQDGKRELALATLTKARQIDADNIDVQILSIEAMLATLREDRTADPELIETLDRLIVQEEKRIEFLSLRLESAIAAQDELLSTDLLLELSSLVLREDQGAMIGAAVLGRSGRRVIQDAWIEARSRQIRDIAIATDRLDKVQEKIAVVLPAISNRQVSTLKRLHRHLAALDGKDHLRTELVSRYAQSGAIAMIERTTVGSRFLSDETIESLPDAAQVEFANWTSPNSLRSRSAILNSLQPKVAESSPPWPPHVVLDWPKTDPQQGLQRLVSQMPSMHKVRHQYSAAFRDCCVVSMPRSPLTFRFPDGRYHRITVDGIRPDDGDEKDAIISGGVMVLHMSGALIAIDLYRLTSGDGDYVLWSHPLTPDGSAASKPRTRPTPFNDTVIRHTLLSAVAGRSLSELEVGPILGDRLLMLRGGELSAIELTSGRTLWQNSDAPTGGSIVSDGDRLAVVSPAIRKTVIFDVADGRMLDNRPFADGEIWASSGAHLLTFRALDAPAKHEIKLSNPITGEILERIETGASRRGNEDKLVAYGRILDGRIMALLDSAGKATIWDILEGKSLCETQLSKEPALMGLNVVKSQVADGPERLLFMTKRNLKKGVNPIGRQLQTQQQTVHRTVDAIYAVNLDDGNVAWTQSFDESWGVTVTQPPRSPLLILARSPFQYVGQRRIKSTDVAAIRTDNGEWVAEELNRALTSSSEQLLTHQTNVDPRNSRIVASVGSSSMIFRFLNELPEEKDPAESDRSRNDRGSNDRGSNDRSVEGPQGREAGADQGSLKDPIAGPLSAPTPPADR